MIKQFLRIFLPEKINDYFILPLKRAGIVIEKDGISAVVFSAWQKKVSMTAIVKENFPSGLETYEEKVQATLFALTNRIGVCDTTITTLSSSHVLFKEMNFPFLSEEKIRLTLNYEIEALLPFPIHEANVNFIITNQNQTPPQSSIMATAIKSNKVKECVELFQKSPIKLSSVNLDVISLYGLYAYKEEGNEKEESVVLLDVHEESTRLLIIHNNHLRYIRVIQSGSLSVSSLVKEIRFTLVSFMDNTLLTTTISKAILFQSCPELEEGLKKEEQLECSLFNPQEILEKADIKLPETKNAFQIPVLALAAAFPFSSTADFSINNKVINQEEESLINMQFISAIILTFATIFILAGNAIVQTRKLSQELEKSQTEILDTLKKGFPHLKSKSLRDALDITGREVKKEESIWSSFSSQTRQSYLHYLYEMSTKIDRESLGLTLKKMIINQNSIALDGKVQSYEALEQLEQQLADTHLFAHIPDLQKMEFSVTLPLDEKGGPS